MGAGQDKIQNVLRTGHRKTAYSQDCWGRMFPGSGGLSLGRMELGPAWDSRGEPQQTVNVSLATADEIQGQEGTPLRHEWTALLEPGRGTQLMREGEYLGLVGRLRGLMDGTLRTNGSI